MAAPVIDPASVSPCPHTSSTSRPSSSNTS
jgi:hypothetical protein